MDSAIVALFRAFFAICLFRAGPQDLPASSFLLGVTAALYTLGGAGLGLFELPATSAVMGALCNTIGLAALTYIALLLRGYASRAVQTVTALCGTGLVLTVLALPVSLWLGASASGGSAPALAQGLWFGLMVWDVFITAHILHHALSVSFPLGLVLSTAYIWFLANLAVLVIAATGPPGGL